MGDITNIEWTLQLMNKTKELPEDDTWKHVISKDNKENGAWNLQILTVVVKESSIKWDDDISEREKFSNWSMGGDDVRCYIEIFFQGHSPLKTLKYKLEKHKRF